MTLSIGLDFIGMGAFTPSVAFSTLNPSDKGSNITLSNGNRTATGAANTGDGVRGTQSRSSGKRIFETVVSTNTSGYAWHGIATSTEVLTGYAGTATNRNKFIGFYSNGTTVYYIDAGGSTQTIGTYTGFSTGSTHTATYAIDFDASLLWLAINGGNWNASGAADPATGTGGWSIASGPTGPFFPYIGCDLSDVQTINTGQAAFAKATPSGFTAWG